MKSKKEPPLWHAALKIIAPILAAAHIDYKITGGTVAALYGIPTLVNDIDIEVSAEDAYRFQGLFINFLIQSVILSDNGEHRSHFGQFKINGVLIDLMGNLHRREENRWIPSYTLTHDTVELNGTLIHVPWLEEETLAYIRRGKLQRAGQCLPYCNQIRLLALLQGKQPTHVI